ncbi:hypothetical protein TSUD_294150 [Trifolium subterraneum]|uniref:Uncharacterized protein n=1 Tax=Trifolium subterraneum TaxID=3900 RepID=A0A2Z6N4Q4_TRISU|nr:hypothetical protein TSUD_294150 [Trifolium subterraneum]
MLVFNPERVKEVQKDRQTLVLDFAPEEKVPPQLVLELASDSEVAYPEKLSA